MRLPVALEVLLGVLRRGETRVQLDALAVDFQDLLAGLNLPEVGIDQLAGLALILCVCSP